MCLVLVKPRAPEASTSQFEADKLLKTSLTVQSFTASALRRSVPVSRALVFAGSRPRAENNTEKLFWRRRARQMCVWTDRQTGRQGDGQQSRCTNTAEVNAITETSRYFVAFHHHHLSRSLALSPSFMAGFLIDDKAIYVSLIPPSRLPLLHPPRSLPSPSSSSWSLSDSPPC